MNTARYSLHRRAGGDPADVRVVPGGFRLSVFLLPPAGLLARGLWGATLVWLAMAGAIGAAVAAGWLSPLAALSAILVIHAAFALDAADLERRRLARKGWPIVALAGPLGTFETPTAARAPGGSAPSPVTQAGSTDVVGLFPS